MDKIKVQLLREHPRNKEFFDDIEGERWKDFVESIKTSGIIVPLVVTRDYTVVSGNQRLRAAKELGLEEVPCEVKTYEGKNGISKEDWILKDLIETNLRQRGIGNLNPVKTAKCIIELERIYGVKKGGYRGDLQNLGGQSPETGLSTPKNLQKKIIENTGLSRSRYHEIKKLNDLIPELQVLVESGRLSSSAGARLAYLEPEQQKELYNTLGNAVSDLKRSEAEAARKQMEETRKKLEEMQARIAELEKQKREAEKTKSQIERRLAEIKPEVVEKVPDDYIKIKKALEAVTARTEELTIRLKKIEEEKSELERQNRQYFEELKCTKKERDKYIEELSAYDRARAEEKYNFQLTQKLSDFAQRAILQQ